MSFKNIKSNISPKARIILLSVGLIAAGSIWTMYSAFSEDESDLPDVVSGVVKIDNKNDTVEERGDRKKLLPDDSVQQQEIDQLKEEHKKEQIKKGSFMEQLELNNDVKVLEEIEKELGSRDIETGVDDVSDKLKERQVKAQELLEKQRRAKQNNQENQANGSSVNGGASVARTAYIPEPFDEKAFMDEERTRLEKKRNLIDGYAKTLTISTIGGVGMGNIAMAESQDASGDKPETSSYSGKTNYNKFIRDPSEYPKADASSLNKFRNMARGDLGEDAQNGMNNNDSSYEDVVYPNGAPVYDNPETITAGEMFYSVLEIEVNTDEISPVRATIVQEGPLKNAVLIGMPERTGAKSMIKFTTMSLNGITYNGLNVVAVDPNTMRTAFADDVDYHTFERYFKLAAASVIAGYSEALVSVEEQTTAAGTEKNIRGAIPDAGDRMAVALGRVGEKLEPKFLEQFDRPPTVTISKNRDLGIMFLSELIINGKNK